MKNLKFYPSKNLNEVITGVDVLIQLIYEAIMDAIELSEGNLDWPQIVSVARELIKRNEAGNKYEPDQILHDLVLESVSNEFDRYLVKIKVITRSGETRTMELNLEV